MGKLVAIVLPPPRHLPMVSFPPVLYIDLRDSSAYSSDIFKSSRCVSSVCFSFFFFVRSRLLGFGLRRHPSHAYFKTHAYWNLGSAGRTSHYNIFFGLYARLGGHPSHAYFRTHAYS